MRYKEFVDKLHQEGVISEQFRKDCQDKDVDGIGVQFAMALVAFIFMLPFFWMGFGFGLAFRMMVPIILLLSLLTLIFYPKRKVDKVHYLSKALDDWEILSKAHEDLQFSEFAQKVLENMPTQMRRDIEREQLLEDAGYQPASRKCNFTENIVELGQIFGKMKTKKSNIKEIEDRYGFTRKD